MAWMSWWKKPSNEGTSEIQNLIVRVFKYTLRPYFKIPEIFVIHKECPLEMHTSIFQMRTTIFKRNFWRIKSKIRKDSCWVILLYFQRIKGPWCNNFIRYEGYGDSKTVVININPSIIRKNYPSIVNTRSSFTST